MVYNVSLMIWNLEKNMPYLFGALVIANVALFGFLWLNPIESEGSVEKVKSELQQPISVINSSNDIPSSVGQK